MIFLPSNFSRGRNPLAPIDPELASDKIFLITDYISGMADISNSIIKILLIKKAPVLNLFYLSLSNPFL